MEYRMKVITPLGTFIGRDTQELDDEGLAKIQTNMKLAVEDAVTLSLDTNEGWLVFGEGILKNSILGLELAE